MKDQSGYPTVSSGRKRYLLPVLFLFFSVSISSQNLTWVRQTGGSSLDYSYSMAVDKNGYTYTTGFFQGTSDFDPGPAALNFTSAGIEDVFVEKLDPLGNLVWAKRFGSTSSDYGYGIVVDDSGNVFTTGYFQGKCDFDPGSDTFFLSNAGARDVFISKLDASGNFKWAKKVGGSSYEAAYCIALDDSGNVFLTGEFMGKADFDPGLDTFFLNSAGNFDIFVLKLDKAGNFRWAKRFGGPAFDSGRFIQPDSAGNCLVTGAFRSAADFDPGPGTFTLNSNGSDDIFLVKLDPQGNLAWAKSTGGPGTDYSYSLARDKKGNIYTTGIFEIYADFDPGTGTDTLYSKGGGDAFIQKLDADGNYRWARTFGGKYLDEIKYITLDDPGYMYITGGFEDTVDMDPGPAVYSMISKGSWDVFINKLDTSGNLVWGVQLGSSDLDYSYSIGLDAGGYVYTTGFFYGTVDFDPGPGVASMTSYGQSDFFVHKMNQLPVSVKKLQPEEDGFVLYPNPAQGFVTLFYGDAVSEGEITIFDFTGKQVATKRVQHASSQRLDISGLGEGMYVLMVKMGERSIYKKLVVGGR